MADDITARWALPLLAPGQAQKEMSHNEALAGIDMLVQPVVVAAGIETPPDAPAEGACWIVGAAPTGAWAGHADEIAGWTAGGWRFVMPRIGMTAWVTDQDMPARFGEGEWTIGELVGDSLVLGGETMLAAPAPALAEPVGGSTIDIEARAGIAEILSVLRRHRLILTT